MALDVGAAALADSCVKLTDVAFLDRVELVGDAAMRRAPRRTGHAGDAVRVRPESSSIMNTSVSTILGMAVTLLAAGWQTGSRGNMSSRPERGIR